MKFAILTAAGFLAASVAITFARVIKYSESESRYYAMRDETERELYEREKAQREENKE